MDYVATKGQYVGQDYVAIPVTILGDKFAEADETFMLEVKLGGITLVAVHTIVYNDML